ncbi:MAG TPA: cobalamin-binding protein [Terriglobales bacterium]|nr:cobalamin-binding protein [Terriglobales bacterium]
MRIVSLLPSATEILFALGFDQEIVGVSHECDFPRKAHTKPVVIHSRIPKEASPTEIDRLVREYVSHGESVYTVDAERLESLAPDLIVTQDLCHVCAASPDDLAAILARSERSPQVLCLNPQELGDVWRDILWVGEETFRGAQAERLLERIAEKLCAVDRQVRETTPRPRVAFLEWLQPLYVGGHWVPEMIEAAGGKDVFGKPGMPSFRITAEEVIEAAPEIVLVAPCGYTADRARQEFRSLAFPEAWNEIPAMRNGKIFALEANSYFSRPGPRLVTGIEILSKVLHPQLHVNERIEKTILPIGEIAQKAFA